MDKILENVQIIDGNNIKVAKFMSPDELGSYVEKSRRCRIYIKRLPMDFDNKKLNDLFVKYGKINKAYCVNGTKARKNLKYGYVLFEEEVSIENLPTDGVPFKNMKLQWTCYKHKIEKRKAKKAMEKHSMMVKSSHLSFHQTSNFYPRQQHNNFNTYHYNSHYPSQNCFSNNVGPYNNH